jgi:hypothetical protein
LKKSGDQLKGLIELAHAGAQGAAVEAKDFSRTVFAADFPMTLFK